MATPLLSPGTTDGTSSDDIVRLSAAVTGAESTPSPAVSGRRLHMATIGTMKGMRRRGVRRTAAQKELARGDLRLHTFDVVDIDGDVMSSVGLGTSADLPDSILKRAYTRTHAHPAQN